MNVAVAGYLKTINLLKGTFLLFIAILTILTLGKYPGAPHAYILFTLVFNILVLAGFREKRIFFDTFIGIFLWLGFWLKVSFVLLLSGGQFAAPVGNFDFSGPAFDHALNVSSCGALALFLASLIRERFYIYFPANTVQRMPAIDVFYSRFRRNIWIAYVVLVLLIALGNAYFGFYQKGLPPRTVLPFGLSGFYTLALLFGLASVSAVLLNCEFKTKQSPYIPVILSFWECFLSNISMLSRGMILNGTALVVGVFENARLQAIPLKLRFKIVLLCVFVGLFMGSLFTVNYIRVSAFEYPDERISDTLKKTNRSFNIIGATRFESFVNRWVGIEGVMSVTSYSGLGWNLWEKGCLEKYNTVGTSLYDKTIIGDSPYLGKDISTKHFITLPGIIAFLYYPGSIGFLFLAMFSVGLFAAGVDFIVYKLSGANIILCSLLGQVVAGRYVHFGYVPRQSYLLFGGILLVAFSIFIINNALSSLTPGRGSSE